MKEPVFHGSVVLREDAAGNLSIDSAHVGGFVRYTQHRHLTVIEPADILDLMIALHRMYPALSAQARDAAVHWGVERLVSTGTPRGE